MAGTAREFIPTFERVVDEHGQRPALVLLRNFEPGLAPDERGPACTYAELRARARRTAAGLAANGLRGERVLLLHPTGLEFAVAMLACMYAGAIAVPAPPPTALGRGVARLAGIVEDAGVACVVTDTAIAEEVRAWLAEAGLAGRLPCLTEPELDGGDGDGPSAAGSPSNPGQAPAPNPAPAPAPASVAFLQYTSGSTSEPKGVVVSHRALGHNLTQIGKALRLAPGFRSVGWLPHYHDMGLVGQLLASLYHGGVAHLMSPMAFLKRPYQWLAMVSELRAQYTTGPNFAYELVTNRTTDAQLAALDLSCLDAALNGSEPVHEATLTRFAGRFGPAGLRPETLMPCYGMAETTLLVSATPLTAERVVRRVDAGALEQHRFEPVPAAGDGARPVVSSGRVVDLDVRIVDPDTREELPEQRVGEIWIAGESLADGYYGRPDATAATFGARLAGGAGDTGGTGDAGRTGHAAGDTTYLRTGDLGALVDGELFVTGRIKEVLVLNGRNHYPQDLERTVRAAHTALAANQTAVFAAPFGETAERAVAVQELRPADLRTLDAAELADLVRRQVWLEHEVQLGDVVFVPSGSVPRTTSGKIRRGQVRELFLGGGLPALTSAGTRK